MWIFSLELGGVLAVITVALVAMTVAVQQSVPEERPALTIALACLSVLAVIVVVDGRDSTAFLRGIDFQIAKPFIAELKESGLRSKGAFPLENGGYFYVRSTGFSPDPYCGYEFAEDGSTLELDPLGSGHGVATQLEPDWYWICAS